MIETYTTQSTMKHVAVAAAKFCVIPVVIACGAVGDDTPASLGRTDVPLAVDEAAPFTEDVQNFEGRWVGVADDPLALGTSLDAAPVPYRFPSGSDQIILELQIIGDSTIGTLTFGSGAVPPPPVDPEIGFPTDVRYAELLRYAVAAPLQFAGDLAFDRGVLPPEEGFPYALVRPDALPDQPVADGLLRVTYQINEVLSDWCALQTPHAAPGVSSAAMQGRRSLTRAAVVASWSFRPSPCVTALRGSAKLQRCPSRAWAP